MPDYDRDVLNKARMATFDRSTASEAARAWIDAVMEVTLAHEASNHPRKRARRQTDQLSFCRSVAAFAADLLRHSTNVRSQGFMYRAADREELATTLVSSDNFDQLVKYWTELDLIEKTKFINDRSDPEGLTASHSQRARRFRATRRFLLLAADYNIAADAISDHFDVSHRHSNVVQVRATRAPGKQHRGKLLKQQGQQFDDQRARVRHLNSLIAGHDYSLSESPMVRRVFNCGDRQDFRFNLGGRFYCASDDNWMAMPKTERAKIKIDGEETTEIDVRASHISILSSLTGRPLDRRVDPYAIEGIHRDIVKKVIVSAIGGGKMPTRWPKGFNDEFADSFGWEPRRHLKLIDVTDAITELHPFLLELKKAELDWANLQFEESECFFTAMMRLHNEGDAPSLPVHDSLIVRRRDAGYAAHCLRDAYEDRLGFRPHVDIPDVSFGYLVA
ncbi:MAG: hypothetical protein AB3N15_16835 [Paracoccaceae bacterium]